MQQMLLQSMSPVSPLANGHDDVPHGFDFRVAYSAASHCLSCAGHGHLQGESITVVAEESCVNYGNGHRRWYA